MALEETINNDIKIAMKAKEANKLQALRAIKSSILLLKTSPDGLTETSAIKSLQKMVKQRRDAGELYVQQNRQDLADVEFFEAAIIDEYLPQQMNEDEIKAELTSIISKTGASSKADMGKVMGVATKAMAGKADGKLISTLVKQLLS
ncbi:MAG: hypothetical protein ACI9U0_001103 [Flavobacteriales bacterium]|jgi:uncharacterized protein YqeY|tara:strand:+ start:557 stop:997 length:441 start_codon:yes stop_codon:yes gene_type:complete